MYEKETNRQMGDKDSGAHVVCFCGFHCTGRHFLDKYGQEWLLAEDGTTIIRVSDGSLGNYYNGQGLTEIRGNKVI